MKFNIEHFVLSRKLILINLLLSFLLIPLNLLALAESDNSSLNYLQANKKVYVFNDQASFSSEPKSDASVLQKLQIGTELIVEAESRLFIENSIQLPWVKVSLNNNNKKQVGYIWSGDLAKVALTVDLDSDEIQERILTGFMGRVEEDFTNYYSVKIIVLRHNKELLSYNFKVPYSEVNDLETSFFKSQGFSDKLDFIKLNFIPGACGVMGGNVLLAIYKGEIIPVLDEDYISEAGSYRDYNKLVLPADKGGIANTIKVIRIVETNWDDLKNKYRDRKTAETNYLWDGLKFNKLTNKNKITKSELQ
jgi:hypothetical protein